MGDTVRGARWAIESAGGLGFLLSEQLVAAGEQVIDVPATLAARVRLLGTGRSKKNDANDARSVAIAALRAPQLAAVNRAEVVRVLRLLANVTTTSGEPATAPPVDCTPCSPSSSPAASPMKSTLPALSGCSPASSQQAQSK